MARRVIIGIHGLGNKPKVHVLEEWWRASIAEGLQRHGWVRVGKYRFELAYWADLMYPKPLVPAEMLEPYAPAPGSGPLPRGSVSVVDAVKAYVRGGLGKALERASRLRLGEDFVTGTVKARMPDLHSYKTHEELRRAIQARLIRRLRSARRWRREVMVIAHSMGSIVAYEVLRDVGDRMKGLQVAHFVTVGSPLGLAGLRTVVDAPLRVPECVAHWSNFSDMGDPVASWDIMLSNNYRPNSRGVTVSDRLVDNSYVNPADKPNPHKIYGYLRTPEMAEAIAGFLR